MTYSAIHDKEERLAVEVCATDCQSYTKAPFPQVIDLELFQNVGSSKHAGNSQSSKSAEVRDGINAPSLKKALIH